MNQVDDVSKGKGKKPDPSERGMEVLLREGAASGDPHVRGYATFMLGGLKDPGLVDYYVSRLRDPDKKVRGQAAAALAALGEQAIPALVPLLRDDDWVVRYRAVETIGLMKDDRRAGLLIEALSDGKDHVRYMAAKGLSQLHTGAALEALAGTLSDSNEYVRKMAARAVAGIGGIEAVALLEKASSKETDPGVKSVIRDLIAGIKEE